MTDVPPREPDASVAQEETVAVDATSPTRAHWDRRLELIIAIALGLAAIAGAFAAYRNEQENHAASEQFAVGITNFDEAGHLYAAANATMSRDQGQFLSYVTALHDHKVPLADFIRHHLMDERLQAAVTWWQSAANMRQPKPAPTPFTSRNPSYRIAEETQANERTADSKRRFEQAKTEQKSADHYELIAVILATALFLYGIAGVTHSMTVKLATVGTGGAIFVASIVLLITG